MGGGGGGQPQTTVNKVDERFNPLIDYVTQGAAKINSSGYTPYGGQRYAGTNATQQQGLNMVADRALNGDPLADKGGSYLQAVLGGTKGMVQPGSNPYAGSNPYLDSAISKAQGGVMGNMAALQARSGSFGNSGIAEQGAKQMSEIASNMRMQDYGQQQQLAESGLNRGVDAQKFNSSTGINAAQLGFGYADQQYKDASQLMNAGQFQQNQDQQNKDFSYQQFADQQNQPYKQMAAYTGVLGAGINNTATTTGGGGGK